MLYLSIFVYMFKASRRTAYEKKTKRKMERIMWVKDKSHVNPGRTKTD